MLLKRLCFLLTIFILLSSFSIPISAATTDIIYSKDTAKTSQFLVTIYRPEGDETRFDKSYVVCGGTDKADIRVELLIFNDRSGKYEPLRDVDGEYIWDVSGSDFSSVFTKEVILPNENANKVRIAAYKKSEVNKLIPNTNLQINDFTITVLKKSFIDSLKSNFSDMIKGKIFKDIF